MATTDAQTEWNDNNWVRMGRVNEQSNSFEASCTAISNLSDHSSKSSVEESNSWIAMLELPFLPPVAIVKGGGMRAAKRSSKEQE